MISRLISCAVTLAIIGFIWNLVAHDSFQRFVTNMQEAIDKTF